MRSWRLLLLLLAAAGAAAQSEKAPAEPWEDASAGYLVYCHCMGRFGNQAEHLLGALAWARDLNRTLVLPPFVEYRGGATTFRPVTDLFALAPLSAWHRVVDMETFMRTAAPAVWPAASRNITCFQAPGAGSAAVNCRATEGNPVGTFWRHFGITFRHQVGTPLLYSSAPAEWRAAFPPAAAPVLATTNAPGPYPLEPRNRALQRLLQWTPARQAVLADTIATHIRPRLAPAPADAWVAVHLRAGSDWARACEHAVGQATYMASTQCTVPPGGISQDICLPAVPAAARDVLAVTAHTGARLVYLGSDNPEYARELAATLTRSAPQLHVLVGLPNGSSDKDPLLDLQLYAAADAFIGNCVSSFTAFARRQRDSESRRLSFFFGLVPRHLRPRQEL